MLVPKSAVVAMWLH